MSVTNNVKIPHFIFLILINKRSNLIEDESKVKQKSTETKNYLFQLKSNWKYPETKCYLD